MGFVGHGVKCLLHEEEEERACNKNACKLKCMKGTYYFNEIKIRPPL